MQNNDFYFQEYVKYHEYFNSMLQYALLLQKNLKIDEYLASKGYHKIVIYGMSDIGNLLVGDLIHSSQCQFLYAIDQGNPKLYYDIDCYPLKEVNGLEKPDIVVITLPHLYEQIRKAIKQQVDCKIISITELVYNAYYHVEAF